MACLGVRPVHSSIPGSRNVAAPLSRPQICNRILLASACMVNHGNVVRLIQETPEQTPLTPICPKYSFHLQVRARFLLRYGLALVGTMAYFWIANYKCCEMVPKLTHTHICIGLYSLLQCLPFASQMERKTC